MCAYANIDVAIKKACCVREEAQSLLAWDVILHHHYTGEVIHDITVKTGL